MIVTQLNVLIMLLLLDFNNGLIIAWFQGTVFPIYMRYATTVFEDSHGTHVGQYNTIPSGFANVGAIAIGF